MIISSGHWSGPSCRRLVVFVTLQFDKKYDIRTTSHRRTDHELFICRKCIFYQFRNQIRCLLNGQNIKPLDKKH